MLRSGRREEEYTIHPFSVQKTAGNRATGQEKKAAEETMEEGSRREKEGIIVLRAEIKNRLYALRKAENLRKGCKKK